MSDVFISYARPDRPVAELLAQALEAEGHVVWWDRDVLPGKDFAELIAGELASARAVVVLWTPHSVRSRWVRDEAQEGLGRGILVPVLFGVGQAPMGYRSVHAVDLTGWNGGDHPALTDLKVAIDALRKTGNYTASKQDNTHHEHMEAITMADSSPPWSTILAAVALMVIIGTGLASIYSSVQQAVHELEEIRGPRGMILTQTKLDEFGASLQSEVARSRDIDANVLFRLHSLERNLKQIVEYALQRSLATEELIMRHDPVLGEEYKRMRQRDFNTLQNLIPPIEREIPPSTGVQP